MTNSIELQNLTMRFRETTALDDISVSFGENKIYGLLGRNGAGKSTLLNCVTNRLFPTEGRVTFNGQNAKENDRVQGQIYYMGEKNFYPEGITAKNLLKWTRDFYPGFDMEAAERLADRFEMNLKKKLKGLSTGYLTIIKLICALSVKVPFVLFDEPVLGLDANHRELFYRELIESYAQFPRTFIISTHLIEEVADIVEQVIILKKGKLLLDKPAEEVRRMGYSVSGRASEVESYCAGRDVLSIEHLGGLQTACILGEITEAPAGLDITPLDLQKLFIRLTNAGGI